MSRRKDLRARNTVPINNLGLLNPGENRVTGTLNLARTCGFHDHNDEFNPSFKGRIVIE
jgi:hypothetical protein